MPTGIARLAGRTSYLHTVESPAPTGRRALVRGWQVLLAVAPKAATVTISVGGQTARFSWASSVCNGPGPSTYFDLVFIAGSVEAVVSTDLVNADPSGLLLHLPFGISSSTAAISSTVSNWSFCDRPVLGELPAWPDSGRDRLAAS